MTSSLRLDSFDSVASGDPYVGGVRPTPWATFKFIAELSSGTLFLLFVMRMEGCETLDEEDFFTLREAFCRGVVLLLYITCLLNIWPIILC